MNQLNDSRNKRNKSEDESEAHKHTETHQENPNNSIPNLTETDSTKNQWWYTPFNWVTDELVANRSHRTRIPTQYIRDIQTGKTTGLMLLQVPLKQLNICQRNGLHRSAKPQVLSFMTQGKTPCLMPNLIRTLAISSPIVFPASRNYLTLSKQMHGLDPQEFRPTRWKSNTTKCLTTTKHSCLSKSGNQPNACLVLDNWLMLQSLTMYAFTLATVLPEL